MTKINLLNNILDEPYSMPPRKQTPFDYFLVLISICSILYLIHWAYKKMNHFQKRRMKDSIAVEEVEPMKRLVKKVLTKSTINVPVETEPPIEVSHHGSNGDDFLTEGLE